MVMVIGRLPIKISTCNGLHNLIMENNRLISYGKRLWQ